MTAVIVRPVGQPDPVREALIEAGHHPLAFCEFCQQPIDAACADCPELDCQRKAIEVDMYFVRLEDQ